MVKVKTSEKDTTIKKKKDTTIKKKRDNTIKKKKLNKHQRKRLNTIKGNKKMKKELVKKKKQKEILKKKVLKDAKKLADDSNEENLTNENEKLVSKVNGLKNSEVVASPNWLLMKDKIAQEDKMRRESSQSTQSKRKSDKSSEQTTKKSKENEPPVWFDNVDPILLQNESSEPINDASKLITDADTSVTKAIAIDCEMVGVGIKGCENHLARVTVVNHFGNVLYDQFVKPQEKVTDYRTFVSGIRPADLLKGSDFKTVQKEVADLTKDRILVGHALQNDLKCLLLSHPRNMIRDTAKYKPFRTLVGGGTPSLKKLALKILSMDIQEGEHSSIQDAQATMRIYTLNRKDWEKYIRDKKAKGKQGGGKKEGSTEEDGSGVVENGEKDGLKLGKDKGRGTTGRKSSGESEGMDVQDQGEIDVSKSKKGKKLKKRDKETMESNGETERMDVQEQNDESNSKKGKKSKKKDREMIDNSAEGEKKTESDKHQIKNKKIKKNGGIKDGSKTSKLVSSPNVVNSESKIGKKKHKKLKSKSEENSKY